MADVALSKIKKSYGNINILHGIDLDIKHGEFVVLVGASGCGKSTLLRLIAGLEEISEGELRIAGETVNDISPAKRGIAMVFQSYALYPHMTVFKNMSYGLKVTGKGKDYIKEKVEQAAKTLHIDHLLDRLPRELSGGQRQRVAIGRAIVRDPNVFLFDEPLSNLDAALRVQTRVEIGKLHQELGATIIYVTHDQIEAKTLGDKIVVMNDGRVEQCGAPLELYNYPKTQFVAGFIGSPKMNFIKAKVTLVESEHVDVELIDGTTVTACVDVNDLKVGDIVTVGIRPEHLYDELTIDSKLEVEVTLVERLGEASYIYVKMKDGTELIVRSWGEGMYEVGENISVSLQNGNIHLFNENGLAYKRLQAKNVKTPVELAAHKQVAS